MTIDGCISAETACGQSLVKIALRLAEGDLSINEITQVLTPAFRGGGNNMTPAEVSKIVYEAGTADGMRVAGEVLTNVITAGKDFNEDEGEEKNVEPALLDSE